SIILFAVALGVGFSALRATRQAAQRRWPPPPRRRKQVMKSGIALLLVLTALGVLWWPVQESLGAPAPLDSSLRLLFVLGSPSGDSLLAVQARTGAEVWSFRAGNYVTSPVVADGVAYVEASTGVVNAALYALNVSDGSQRWRAALTGDTGRVAV